MSTFFIIESGYKTSYITNTLVALFYSNKIDHKTNPINYSHLYLYQTFKLVLIDKIRKGQTIFSENLNRVRNLLIACDWKKGEINDINDVFKEYDVTDFYEYLVNVLGIESIKINSTHDNRILTYFNIKPVDKQTDIDDFVTNEYTSKINVINDVPYIICVRIDRENNNKNLINIKKKINFLPMVNEYSYLSWDFYSAICYNGEYYYTLILINDEYYILDEKKVPCLEKINLDNENIMMCKKIMSQCVLIFYSLDL